MIEVVFYDLMLVTNLAGLDNKIGVVGFVLMNIRGYGGILVNNCGYQSK